MDGNRETQATGAGDMSSSDVSKFDLKVICWEVV